MKKMKYYEAKFKCCNCDKKLHVVEMETIKTIEECPFCGYKQDVTGKAQKENA